MKWRPAFTYEGDETMQALGQAALTIKRGRKYRVTIEEAVDEQARKGLLAYGGAEARRIHDAAFPHAPLEPGRNIRITMEEEVNAKECCEKWRRRQVLVAWWDFVDEREKREYIALPLCPECGEPLREA
jgi:hypothetical protein